VLGLRKEIFLLGKYCGKHLGHRPHSECTESRLWGRIPDTRHSLRTSLWYLSVEKVGREMSQVKSGESLSMKCSVSQGKKLDFHSECKRECQAQDRGRRELAK
jgi:hypothetical protein